MLKAFTLALPLALLSCIPPALSQDAAQTGDWQMIALDGAPWGNRVRLTLQPDGSLTISTGCHGYWGPSLAGLRRLNILMDKEYSCPRPDNDVDFLPLITAQTTLALQGDYLILTGPDGRTATFQHPARQ